MQSRDPSLMLFTGQARARGFVLEGYGIFFDVEVPSVCGLPRWSMMTVQRDTTVAVARVTPPRPRGAPGGTEAAGSTTGAADRSSRSIAREPRRHRARRNRAPLPNGGRGCPRCRRPRPSYTEAVKSALIDAMLDYSLGDGSRRGGMAHGGCARQRRTARAGPALRCGDHRDLRVKGSDLATYAADAASAPRCGRRSMSGSSDLQSAAMGRRTRLPGRASRGCTGAGSGPVACCMLLAAVQPTST